MTDLEDLREQVKALAGARGVDVADIEALTFPQAQLEVAGYRLANASRDLTGLDRFVAWLNVAASVMGPIGTIAGALAAGIGVAGAASKL